jgi:hypothetical protein
LYPENRISLVKVVIPSVQRIDVSQ